MTEEAVQANQTQDAANNKKVRVRGGHRAHLTKLMKDVDKCLDGYTEANESQLLTYKSCLARKNDVISKLDEDILQEMDDEEQLVAEIEAAEDWHYRIIQKTIEIEAAVKKPLSNLKVGAPPEPSTPKAHVRLPKLEIEKFAGDPKKYVTFRDAFDVAVVKNSSLSDGEKFTYLKSYLSGEAARLVAGLAVTNDNYKEAMALIEKRFGNKQVIINSHMEALMKIPPVRSSDDTKGLRMLFDNVEVNLRSLKALGVRSNAYGCLLVPVMKSKLPHEINLILSRKFDSSEDIWEIDDMMRVLSDELEARERCHSDVNQSYTRRAPSTTEGLLTQGRVVVCPYCEKGHFPDRCRIVTNIARRTEILTEKKRCFSCTKPGHTKKDCFVKKSCFICNGRHHTSICTEKPKYKEKEEEKKDVNEVNTTTAITKNMSILLQTASVHVGDPLKDRGSVKCKLIMDTGSQKTYITEGLRRKIGLERCDREMMSIGAFGGNSKGPKEYDVVEVGVRGSRSSETVYMKAVVVENICSPLQGQKIDVAQRCYLHLKNLKLADDKDRGPVEVDMLVGLDNYWRVITGGVVKGKDGPVALASKFGYILSGPTKGATDHHEFRPSINMMINSTRVESRDGELSEKLEKFWNLESLGIEDETSQRDDIYGRIEFSGIRYVVSLPWKDDHLLLGDNYVLAEKRLLSQLRRLRKDPEMMKKYEGIMKEQEDKGIIEEVDAEISPAVGATYYMPHQAVVKEERDTTKLRLVYDASSKMEDLSLNDCLEVGETYFADLFGVLIRFRWHRIALLADIEKAFLSIGIRENDRDALRFLWIKDLSAEIPEFRKMRFTRVCFGVGSSMWHLGATIRHHLEKYRESHKDAVEKIESSLYVDDFSGGAQNEEDAIDLYEKSRKIFKEAGMNLRKWKSNNVVVNDVMKQVPDGDGCSESHAQAMLNPDDVSEIKVLGVPWDTKKDEMKFTFRNLIDKVDSDAMTKRKLLRVTASMYDPLGMLSPAVLPLKLMFQKMCKDGGSWNDRLSDTCKEEWEKWLKSAKDCEAFVIPRCYYLMTDEPREVYLIGFCDASEKSYAAVVYIRVVSESDVSTTLIASKTRVAPLKRQTIPRLELLGALILARLMHRVRDVLQKTVAIDGEFCLTDSTVALNWIKNENKKYKQYVENRVAEIRKTTPVISWFHVPGEENVADLPSRGCVPEKLAQVQKKWFEGPAWMKQDVDRWPTKKTIAEDNLGDDELKRDVAQKKNVTFLVEDEMNIQNLIDPARYSSFKKLLRVTAWCLRFVKAFRSREREQGEISAEEMEEARAIWIKSIQKDLREQSAYKKVKDSLGVEEDSEGLLRCRGRFGRGKMPFKSKFPVLLPSFHWVTELIIRGCHENVYHDGVKETLAEVRNCYWIIKGRQRVKAVLRCCRLCKLLEGMPYPSPASGDLPEFRIDGGRAFQTTGVDFCGPVYVKTMYQVKSGKMNKAYIALSTCATSRMIHLELCPDLTTDTYIRSQQRFMARRGIPKMMVSDNGRTFKGRRLRRFNALKGIRWKFNLAKAPWWGGIFERMIRSTKRCLKKAIGSKRLTYEELYTVLTEIEAVINSRPITFLHADDIEEPLTPSHLFCGRRLLDRYDSTEPVTNEDELTPDSAVQSFRKTEGVMNHFWRRWQKEYLMSLREVQRIKKGKDPDVRIGEVVLIKEDNIKRNKWNLGRVEKLIEGRDGVIRGAEVKTAKEGKIGRICRPLQRLYPLEVTNKDDSDDRRSDALGDEQRLGKNEENEGRGSLDGELVADVSDVDLVQQNSRIKPYSSTTRSKRAAGVEGERRRRITEFK